MKKMASPLFPFLFTAFSFLSFLLIGWSGLERVDPLMGALVCLASLGWSAMVMLRDRRTLLWRLLLVAISAAGSVVAVEFLWPNREFHNQYRIIYELVILGIILIQFYFLVEKRKSQD